MRLSVLLVTALALLTPAQQPAPAAGVPASTDVTHVVAAASQWTARFEAGLSGLLFRERYLQKTDGASSAIQAMTTPGGRRDQLLLEANLFLLRADATGEFVLFRDVYKAPGRDVTDHTERLQKLLTAGTAASITQARRLSEASARYNVGNVNRTVNIPTMAFRYLEAAQIGGVQFCHAGTDTVDGLPTVMVDFEEVGTPTLVRGTAYRDVPGRGRYWIHADSGAVVRARVEFDTYDLSGRMEITLELHPELAAWVPKEMTEVWRALGQRTTGLAQYDRYQRLDVSTTEAIK